MLSLLALRWSALWQSAVWGAAAVLAALGIFTSFSGASLVLVPAALLLGPAALVAFSRTAPARWPVALLVAGVLVMLVAGGWLGLNIVDDGRCWELVRDATGETTWRSASYSQRGTVTATTGGEEPGVVRVLCSSDVITGTEAVFGLLPPLMAALLVTWLARQQN